MPQLGKLIYHVVSLMMRKSQFNPKANNCVLCRREATEFDSFSLICSGFLVGRVEAGVCPDCYKQQVDLLPDGEKKQLISTLIS